MLRRRHDIDAQAIEMQDVTGEKALPIWAAVVLEAAAPMASAVLAAALCILVAKPRGYLIADVPEEARSDCTVRL
ncbi:hypothetical protein GCM10017322_35660 [Paracoccus aerius]|nr:hypothetical protein GCM10017322_35660 [Paracoccus aerius]